MRKAEFICPKCGGTELTQVITNCIVNAPFIGITIHDFGGNACLAERSIESCKEDTWVSSDYSEFSFECTDCGYELDVNNIEELAEWLLEHGKITEGESND